MAKSTTVQGTASSGFIALLVAMSCGALNDNLFRGALLLAVAIGGGGMWEGALGEGGTGWVTFMLYGPFIMFLGITGQLADRFPRRTIIVISRVLEVALCGLVILAFSLSNLLLACLALVLLAAQSTLFSPAKYGIVPDLVGDQALSKANGLLSMLTNFMIIVGVAVAGFLLTIGGPWLGVVMLALACVGLVASLFIPHKAAAQPELKVTMRTITAHVRNLRAMRGTPLVVATVAWCWFYAVGSLLIVIVPNYKGPLGLTDTTAGLLLAAPGVGIAIGGVVAGFCSGDRIRGRLVPVGGGFMSIGLLLLALVKPSYIGLLILLGCTGIAAGFFVIPILALLQHLPEAGFRARCIGTANFCTYVAMSITAVAYALLAGPVGSDPQTWFLLCAVLMGGMSIYTFLRRETLRAAGLHESAQTVHADG